MDELPVEFAATSRSLLIVGPELRSSVPTCPFLDTLGEVNLRPIDSVRPYVWAVEADTPELDAVEYPSASMSGTESSDEWLSFLLFAREFAMSISSRTSIVGGRAKRILSLKMTKSPNLASHVRGKHLACDIGCRFSSALYLVCLLPNHPNSFLTRRSLFRALRIHCRLDSSHVLFIVFAARMLSAIGQPIPDTAHASTLSILNLALQLGLSLELLPFKTG